MNYSINKLMEDFTHISKLGYIESIIKSPSSASITYENKLLDINSNYNTYFKNIHFQYINLSSRYPIDLLKIKITTNLAKSFNAITYKYNKSYNNNYNIKLNNKYITKLDKYSFKLNIDYDNKYIYVNVYDIDNNIVDRIFPISFDILENYIANNLNIVALVSITSKKKQHNIYYKYDSISLYTIKSFNTFIKLLNNGIIELNIIHSNCFNNKLYSINNITFLIKKRYITKLFNKL